MKMGGYGSGRYGGRPIKEHALTIDLAWMLRTGRISEGCSGLTGLSWSCGGEPSGSIGARYDLTDLNDSSMTLTYRQKRSDEDWTDREQFIRLVYTTPHFGGRRWWMLCPVSGARVGKLYLPNGGDIFAGRKAWRLGYRCQRESRQDRVIQRLFALQRKLGSREGCGETLIKPKGMWWRTFDRHLEQYYELENQVTLETMRLIGMLEGRL